MLMLSFKRELQDIRGSLFPFCRFILRYSFESGQRPRLRGCKTLMVLASGLEKKKERGKKSLRHGRKSD